MATQEDGFLDGVGGKSSKRLLSIVGAGAALVFPIVAGVLELEVPVAEITSAFLLYSATMQGVSMYQETKLLSGKKK